MIYKTTSIEEVIARIIRNTRIQDSSYIVDFNEWIPEAMGYMQTNYTLVKKWKDIRISYHKGRMPCGLVSLLAVQYKGQRLRYYESPRAADGMGYDGSCAVAVQPGIPLEGDSVFGTHLVKRSATDDGVSVEIYETSLEKVECLPYCDDWYFKEMDYISCSFADGRVRVHYDSLPVDDKGLPLIPDEQNYKEALYYYSRAKMIGAGYNDKAFSESTCMERYEMYAERAMSKITYPSVDEMDAKIERMTRLILPEDFWSSYFSPSTEDLL